MMLTDAGIQLQKDDEQVEIIFLANFGKDIFVS